ncbi:ESAT-6 secretion machinery protein EssC [Lachnospiraceae bacterium]|nr:ESAT-6 secretion machinery protein EssC [Lachnospiraceae bacterium]
MRELISVAQVGRSLGVHLILATQKPGGTVDDNIWSNSKFRLCLRVQDRQDSNDMLHRPEAAYITQAGRCYMQVGNDELFELFQSGWSGAAYEEDGAQRKTVIAKMLSLTGKAALVGKRAKTHKRKEAGQKERTQLDAVVDYLKLLAKENGYTHMLQLWLPVLPVSLYLKQLKGYKSCFDGNTWRRDRQEWNLETPVGMYDDPVNQSQDTVRLSLSQNGHHAVIGTVASGKSTFLQTFVFAMVSRYSPSDIHIYAIDFSVKMLSAFERMPHVGGIIYENEMTSTMSLFIRTSSINSSG